MLRRCALALSLALAPWAAAVPAQAPLELKLRAAFLYNFARLSSWPPEKFADPSAPLEACVLDSEPLAPALEQAFAGKVVEGRPLSVRRLPGLRGWERCHIAYVGRHAPELGREVLRGLVDAGVLTVHEGDAALHEGVIRLFIAERKLRFEVNQAAAERAHVRLNARLMALASVVRTP